MSIIEVHNVTKEYRLGQITSLKQTLLNSLNRIKGTKHEPRKEFKALDNVDFSVEPGEVLGIIGHNGAGKSTLLKILSGISNPTRGSVAIHGKIAPLIEVGAGFVGDFTGRENVYLNGSILGLSRREIDKKFDEIVDFAEMSQFIDTPVKRYSSGMQVRLAFAVATSIDAEILIVDEVLAVGDLAFQRKCFDRIEELIKRQKKTVLLVSHNIRQVQRLCDRVIMLEKGRVVGDGDTESICRQFYEASDAHITSNSESTSLTHANSNEYATGEIILHKISLLDVDGIATQKIQFKQKVKIRLDYEAKQRLHNPVFGLGIHTTDFIYIATQQSFTQLEIKQLEPGKHSVEFEIEAFPLKSGVYSIRCGVAEGPGSRTIFYAENLLHFQVLLDSSVDRNWNDGFVDLQGNWSLN